MTNVISNIFLSTEKHKPQVFRSILSLVILAKVCVEHNVWTMSGKRTPANFFDLRRNGSAFFVYFMISCCRVLLIALPLTYIRWYMLILPLLVFLLNICLLRCFHLLGKNVKKNVLSAIVSVVVPIGFCGKQEVRNMESIESRMANYYLANNISFSITSVILLVSVNVVLHYDFLSDFYMEACSGMPFTDCHQTWSDALNGGKYTSHMKFFVYGNAFYIGILLLHFILSFYFLKRCCNKIYSVT